MWYECSGEHLCVQSVECTAEYSRHCKCYYKKKNTAKALDLLECSIQHSWFLGIFYKWSCHGWTHPLYLHRSTLKAPQSILEGLRSISWLWDSFICCCLHNINRATH